MFYRHPKNLHIALTNFQERIYPQPILNFLSIEATFIPRFHLPHLPHPILHLIPLIPLHPLHPTLTLPITIPINHPPLIILTLPILQTAHPLDLLPLTVKPPSSLVIVHSCCLLFQLLILELSLAFIDHFSTLLL